MACPCDPGTPVLELALCLAPPPGDYELVLEGFAGASVAVNDEGVWIRSIARDEWLPYIEARDRPASTVALRQALRHNGLDEEQLLCMSVRALLEAARHGSRRAAEKTRSCKRLIAEILRRCRQGASRGSSDAS